MALPNKNYNISKSLKKPPLTSPAPKANGGEEKVCRVCPSQAHPTRWTPYHKGGKGYNPSPAYLLAIGGQFAEEIREPPQLDQRKEFHWRNIDFYRFSQCPQRLISEGIEIVSPVTVAVDTSAQQRDCRN